MSYQLRGRPELKHAIVDRLVSPSATDDLFMAAQGKGIDLRDLLATELDAYKVSHVLMFGPTVFFPTKFALTVTSLVHELHRRGEIWSSFRESGIVSIHWSVSDHALLFFGEIPADL